MRAFAAVTVMVASLVPVSSIHAQQPDGPVVRATLTPERVIVGQNAVLSIDVLAPNYMPAPPVLPDFQIRNLVTRQTGTENIVEDHAGTTYAGVRYEFRIFPMEAARYSISGQSVTVTYADNPPAKKTVSVAVPALTIEAFIPPEGASLKPFVSAAGMTVEQKIERSSPDLKVGDSLTRTVTITADGIPAMLIPPADFASLDGFAVYPSQPVLNDVTDGRSGNLKGMRTEQAVYLLQKPGDYRLPPLTFSWWSVGDQKVESANAGSLTLHVVANPAVTASGSRTVDRNMLGDITGFLYRHWLPFSVLAVAAAVLVWNIPSMIRAFTDWQRRRHAAYLQSEAFYFSRVQDAAKNEDARGTYFSLLDWIDRFGPLAPDRSLRSLKRVAADRNISSMIETMEQNLFGNSGVVADTRPLIARLKPVRRRLLRHQQRIVRETGQLPKDINPVTAQNGEQAA